MADSPRASGLREEGSGQEARMRPSPGPADQPHELVEVVRGLEAEDQQVRRVAAAPRPLGVNCHI